MDNELQLMCLFHLAKFGFAVLENEWYLECILQSRAGAQGIAVIKRQKFSTIGKNTINELSVIVSELLRIYRVLMGE